MENGSEIRWGLLGPAVPQPPEWWDSAKIFYTKVNTEKRYSVEVWIPPDDGEITAEAPGTLRLQLEVTASKEMRILDEATQQEHGQIETHFPKLSYSMHRDRSLVWKVAARSWVLRRHAVQFSSTDRWLFHTPFYWWLDIVGIRNGAVKVIGRMGPRKRLWGLVVAPECDNPDLLAAIALLHRNWLRS